MRISQGNQHTNKAETNYREKKLPAKFKDFTPNASRLSSRLRNALVVVKCSQTGKKEKVKADELCREDTRPLLDANVVKGAKLLLERDETCYPVTILDVQFQKEKSKLKESLLAAKADATAHLTHKRKQSESEQCEPASKRRRVEEQELMIRKTEFNQLMDVIIRMDRNICELKTKLDTLEQAAIVSKPCDAVTSLKQEDVKSIVNGVDVLRIPARDAFQYGLSLLDIFFAKEELASSLVYKSKKSEKPGLDHSKVERMFGWIDKRYGRDYDMKKMTLKMNQKCRDSAGKGEEEKENNPIAEQKST